MQQMNTYLNYNLHKYTHDSYLIGLALFRDGCSDLPLDSAELLKELNDCAKLRANSTKPSNSFLF